MDFLTASFLWAIPLASLPVLIHLLNRRRREVVKWGAMQFLLQAATRRRKRWRFSDWLLMALRAAAVLAIVLALAQPRIKAGWFGVTGPRDVIVVLDNSMSTSLSTDKGPIFNRLIEAAEQFIDTLGERDHIRVLLAAEPGEWLQAEPVPANDNNRRPLLAQIRDLTPIQSGNDMSRCLQRAVEAETADVRAPRIVMVLTDGQAQSWRTEATSSWRALKAAGDKLPAGLAIHVWDIADKTENISNAAIESVTPSRGVVGIGDHVDVTVTIRNTGNRDLASSTVRMVEGVHDAASAVVPALTAGEATQVHFDIAFGQSDVHLMNIEIDGDDDLKLDNAAPLVIESVDSMPILIVEGTPNAEGLRSDAGYFLAALGQLPNQEASTSRAVFRPTLVSEFQVTPQHIREARCVVLADVSSLSSEAAAALNQHVRRGGGLWIALGEQIKPAFFNQVMYADGQGLAALPLKDVIGAADKREPVALIPPPESSHAATRLLADTERLDISRVQIYQRHRFGESKNSPATSVLLSSDRGEPLAVEKVLGRGRAIVQALPLNAHWSNWPLCQAFVVMVHEWLWYLAEPSLPTRHLAAGETMFATLPGDQFGEWAEVITPLGKSFRIASQLQDEQRIFKFSRAWWPGVYQLALIDSSSQKQTRPFVVQRDRHESELAYLNETDRQALTSVAGVHFGAQPTLIGFETGASTHTQPAWAWMLIAILVLMLFELLLSSRLTRGRFVRASDLTMAAG